MMEGKGGMKGWAGVGIQAVWSGFVYALAIADKLIRSGQHRCALVVGTEVYSRILDWNDRGTAVLFGDGAGAVVLRADSKPGIMGSVLHADGSYVDILSVPGNVCGGKIVGSPFVQMDGQAGFKFAVKVLGEGAGGTLVLGGLTPSDIDWLLSHQANVRILEATPRKLGPYLSQ